MEGENHFGLRSELITSSTGEFCKPFLIYSVIEADELEHGLEQEIRRVAICWSVGMANNQRFVAVLVDGGRYLLVGLHEHKWKQKKTRQYFSVVLARDHGSASATRIQIYSALVSSCRRRTASIVFIHVSSN